MENMPMWMVMEDGTRLTVQETSKASSTDGFTSCGGCFFEWLYPCPSHTCLGEDRDGQSIIWEEKK